MKVLLIKDEKIDIDLERCVTILNTICNSVSFESHDKALRLNSPSAEIDFDREVNILSKRFPSDEWDCIFYTTYRKYRDKYFFHSVGNALILSFYGWDQYTNLPLENGIFYFIADVIALDLEHIKRHQETTGCIYDFLWDKTGIDIGMKMGYICADCLYRISTSKSNLSYDLINILNWLSNASKWGKSVLESDEHQNKGSLDWSSFEDEVADIYRKLGAQVRQNINLSGFQIDVYIEEETPSKQKVRSVIECKFYSSKVGNRIVNDFHRVLQMLKEKGHADRGVIVSNSGFTQDASLVAQNSGIDLFHIKDLRAKVIPSIESKKTKLEEKADLHTLLTTIKTEKQKRNFPDIFVLMPFSEDLEDVYYLGITETASRLNYTCERVDQMEFVGPILDKIYDSIRNSKIIIAEVSSQNVNVYYELGYANALNKHVILITRDIKLAPFDVINFNHIIYKSIRDLREKLTKRLTALSEMPEPLH